MNDELRAELRFLITQVRAEVEREKLNGREFILPPRVGEIIASEWPVTTAAAKAANAAPQPPASSAVARPPVISAAAHSPSVPAAAQPPAIPAAAASAPPVRPIAPPSPPGPALQPLTSSAAPPDKKGRPATAKPKAPVSPVAARPAPAGPASGRRPPEPAYSAPSSEPTDRMVSKRLSRVEFPANDTRDLARMAVELTEFGAEASNCRKCGLCETRTHVVYGSGTARHPLLFVGEAPGFNEDQQALPFVGQAGKLLTDIIAAMGFDRDDVYIANLLKCRPPGNRDPLPHEIEACLPWLERQIEMIKPRVMCTLGKYSAQILTGKPKATIGTLRGKVFSYNGIPVVPTYHPAFLLRSPGYKRATWEDVQLVRELYVTSGSGEAQGA